MLPMMKRESPMEPSHFTADQFGSDACRICLKAGNIEIFGENDILDNIIKFAGITINENDNLPRYICDACNQLLEAAVLFRQTAKRTDELLRSVKRFDNDSVTREGSIYSESASRPRTVKSPSEDSYYEHDDYFGNAGSVNETKDDDETDNLSTDSESSADIKNEREYLIIKNFSGDEGDSDNTSVAQTVKSDTNTSTVEDVKTENSEKTDPFTCSNCDTSFKTIGELENHSELEHDIKLTDKVNCAVCGEVVSKSIYKVHIKLHREKYLEKKKPTRKVECKICNKVIAKTYYKRHIKMHGTDDEKAERMRDCTICQKSFTINYYRDHMERIHQLGPNGEKLKHIPNKKKSKHVQCPVCDKSISEKKYKEHLAQHGKPPKKYVCEHCAKEFIYLSAFKTHCLIHKGEFNHKCQFCPYRAQHLGLLKVHVRTHTRDYNYKCTLCPAKFITKSNLNQHLQRHKGQGHIKCHDCDKLFYRKRNMEEHYKTIHLGVRDVLCNICGKGYSHRDRMLSHQIKVHKRETKYLSRVPSYLKAKQELSEEQDTENLSTN